MGQALTIGSGIQWEAKEVMSTLMELMVWDRDTQIDHLLIARIDAPQASWTSGGGDGISSASHLSAVIDLSPFSKHPYRETVMNFVHIPWHLLA